jgi:HEAT repeat protein
LTYVCLGKNQASAGFKLGVDNIILAKEGPAAWAAAANLREPRTPTGTAAEIGKALSDADPLIRDLAAIALRDKGPEALPALPALTSALSDSDPNVRLMAANAIAAIGKQAASAVSALIAAASVEGEELQVLRSYVTALGAIGKPAAEPALPLLKKLLGIPRVRWAAEAAIRNIE